MSLSNHLKHIIKKDESWLSYEMSPLELDGIPKKKDDNNFICLETGTQDASTFIPLEAWENRRKEQDEVKGVLNEAREKAAVIEQESYEKGFAQGEKDGFELGEQKAIKVIQNIENLFDEVQNLKHEILKQNEKEILDLIFSVAEKMVYHNLKSNETAVKDAIFNALELAVEKSKVVINVNPDDYDCVEKLRPELFKNDKALKSIVVTSDPSITRGGCLLETPYGDVDAGVETRLDKIYQCLQDAFNEKDEH